MPPDQETRRNPAGPDDVEPEVQPEPPIEGADTHNPAARPHGTTRDQIKNMDQEGPAQPPDDEREPDDVERPDSTTRP